MLKGTLAVTGDKKADELVNSDPLALLLAMMLDQQIPMERAFIAPAQLQERLGGKMTAKKIAGMDPEKLGAVFSIKPALHRFPGSMAKRAGEMCSHIMDNYGGKSEKIWDEAKDADDLFARLKALPGYGEEKSMIFMAILGKRFKKAPKGWQKIAGPFASSHPRSVADINSRAAFDRVRAFKKAQKAQKKSKQQNPS